MKGLLVLRELSPFFFGGGGTSLDGVKMDSVLFFFNKQTTTSFDLIRGTTYKEFIYFCIKTYSTYQYIGDFIANSGYQTALKSNTCQV